MTSRHKREMRLIPARLMRVYRMMKKNPLKIFVAKEFGLNSQLDKCYLTTLEHLELIESVPAVYRYGVRYQTQRSVMGWRIKK